MSSKGSKLSKDHVLIEGEVGASSNDAQGRLSATSPGVSSLKTTSVLHDGSKSPGSKSPETRTKSQTINSSIGLDVPEISLIGEMSPRLSFSGVCQENADHLEVSQHDLDFNMLTQLVYWYDRRSNIPLEERLGVKREADSKMGRWTRKIPREQIIYASVAGKNKDLKSHLGQPLFRRPQGIDVTRLKTLREAANRSGHNLLTDIVEDTIDKLKPENTARITVEEVKKHNRMDDCWIVIDKKVYDVTAFLPIHPGGDQLIVDAAGYDATGIFELTHGEGLRYSLRILNNFFIGFLDDRVGFGRSAEKLEPFPNSDEPTPEFLGILRTITGALHNVDEENATGLNQTKYKGS